MTLEDFKIKHTNLIEKGVITFGQLGNTHFIVIDRFDGVDFLCEAKELTSPRNDVKKMGYTLRNRGVGFYGKEIETYNNAEDALLALINGKNWHTHVFPNIDMFEFEKITKPIIHKGIKLGMYFTWKNHVFCNLMGVFQYIGEMTE